MSTKKDPELLRQLAAAAKSAPVEAVCHLRGRLSGERAKAEVAALLARVGERVGEEPGRVTVFANLGSFALSASAAFVEELLRQDEVASATANEQPEDALVRPVPPGAG